MKKITKELKIEVSADKAFLKFTSGLKEWWPKEYTWSQDKLQNIYFGAEEDGLCSEIGPHGFRCDWGRITELDTNKLIALKWQIGPKREPVPDSAKASDIKIRFIPDDNSTAIKFEHFNFENHGEGADEYRNLMDSEQGWDYILNCFKKCCEKQ